MLYSRTIRLCALGFVLFAAQGAAAAVPASNLPPDDPAPIHIADPGGLIVSLPGVDRRALVDRIKQRRDRLKQRRHELSKLAERGVTAGDGLITVIMPGGLIYAAYRKSRAEQAKSGVAAIGRELDELDRDLRVFGIGLNVAAADAVAL